MARFCAFLKFLVPLVSVIVTVDSVAGQSAGAAYRGKYLGPLTSRKHSVSGHVYAVDSRTLHLQNFNYDGTGPDAFFWVGFTDHPSPQGIIVPNERGTKEVLTAYHNADITISLPDGLTLRDIKWFAVWCRAYEVNFGDLYIPPNFDYPQPHVIGSILGQGVSSGPIVVVDAQTILVPDFTYDGQAPDLHFWVGRGSPGPDGIRVPDETGGDAALARADKKTLVLSLPGDLTVFDIDYFGVWSRLYNIDYGHVRIQPGLNVPPSLRMLGISPQTRLNCEVLHDESALEIRWSVVGSGETIVFQLVGRIDDGNYMAFGLSGENDRSVMLGGDVAVGWLDESTGRGHVVDYYLERKSVCIGSAGSCPDVHWKEGTNNVRMLSAASVNGFTILTYQRKLGAADIYDKTILTNGSQPVIWAVGPMKSGEAQYHFLRNKDDLSIDFGRLPKWNCPEPEAEPETSQQNAPSPASFLLQSTQTQTAAAAAVKNTEPSTVPTTATTTTTTTTIPPITSTMAPTTITERTVTPEVPASTKQSAPVKQTTSTATTPSQEYKAPATAPSPASWAIPPIPCYEPDDRVYYAQLGPTGGAYGYRSITGRHDKPQEAWYINGLLLPEIYLVRNLNYTFVIQGGDNPDTASDYNPLYITDDPEGGHETKSLIERQGVKVYAGVEIDSRGRNIPTAVGKLCRWMENGNQPADFFTSYAAYQRSLFLNCDKGHSGVLYFTPDKDTPDVLYYQSYTKRHLGWKIHVVDDCEVPSESKVEPVHGFAPQQPGQLQGSSGSESGAGSHIIHSPQLASLAQQHHHHHHQVVQLHHHHQQGSPLHLNEQSRSPDQRPGESANHQSVVAPLVPIGDSKTILSPPGAASISPISGLESGRPMENAYLFAASSSPTAAVPLQLSLPSPVLKQQQQQQLQQQQHHQIPSIISLDPNRLLINAKPVDSGVPHGLQQYASLQGLHSAQGHTVLSMGGQPNAYHFQHSGPFFQVQMDPGSGAGGSRIQTPATFSPSGYHQLSPLQDAHLLRRAGPSPPQALTAAASAGPLKFSKMGERAEMMYDSQRSDYYVGANRAPLLSHPIRYDGIPVHSIVYATTGSPPISRVNNPITYLAHGEKHGESFQELGAGSAVPGQNAQLVRFQDGRLRSPELTTVIAADNVKYLEVPGATHNIHIMHGTSDAGGSRIAPGTWTQSRNLPKREQKYPYFPEPSLHFNKEPVRGGKLKSLSSPRNIRQNDNVPQSGKIDEPTNSPLQSSTQVRGNNKGIKTIPIPNQPTFFLLAPRHRPGNHETVNPRSHSSTSLHALAAPQRSRPPTQGALQQGLEDSPPPPPPSTAENGSRKDAAAGAMLTLKCNPNTTNSPCKHDHSNLQLSQQPLSLEISSKQDPPASTTLSQSSPELSGVGVVVVPESASAAAAAAVPAATPPPAQLAQPQSQREHVEIEGEETIAVGLPSGESNSDPESIITSNTSSTSGTTNDDHGGGAGGGSEKKMKPTKFPTMMIPMESGASRQSAGTGAGGNTTASLEKVDGLSPVYESFSPVFRPSPLDIDGFNVSMNFGVIQQQRQAGSMAASSQEGAVQLGAVAAASQSQPSISSPHGSSQGHQFTSGKRKFRHPQLLVNIGGPFPSQKHQREGPREKALSSSAPLGSKLSGVSPPKGPPFPPFAFANNERLPTGFPPSHFHEAIKLFNFPHRHQQQQHYPFYRQHHQQQRHSPIHFPIFPIPSRKRLPVPQPSSLPHRPLLKAHSALGPAAAVGANGPSNGQSGARNTPSGHNAITSRNDQFASHSSPVITILSTPDLASSQGGSPPSTQVDNADREEGREQGGFPDFRISHPNSNSSRGWAQLESLTGEEGIRSSEKDTRKGFLPVPPLSSAEETSQEEDGDQEEELEEEQELESLLEIGSSPSTNSIVSLGRVAPSSSSSSSSWGATAPNITSMEDLVVGDKVVDTLKEGNDGQDREEEEEGGYYDETVDEAGKAERKDGSGGGGGTDGDEEGTAPDKLSLTLLTDIWQTINQDNGSKSPSQKPPAAVPPPPPHSLRYNGQEPLLRAQSRHPSLPPRMLASGGRARPGLLFPRRRTPPGVLQPPSPPPPPSPLHFGQRTFRKNGRDHLSI